MTMRNRYPTDAPWAPAFRAPGGKRRKPVKGGRWNIRKYSLHHKHPEGRQWRAWRPSSTKPWENRWFATHAEAVAYVSRQLAFTYPMPFGVA